MPDGGASSHDVVVETPVPAKLSTVRCSRPFHVIGTHGDLQPVKPAEPVSEKRQGNRETESNIFSWFFFEFITPLIWKGVTGSDWFYLRCLQDFDNNFPMTIFGIWTNMTVLSTISRGLEAFLTLMFSAGGETLFDFFHLSDMRVQ